MTAIDRRRFLAGAGAGALLAAAGLGCQASRPAGAAKQPVLRTTRVVVVGAGLAGLTVAHELVKRGLDVLVLEATAVPGGRIRTIRNIWDGLYVEAGAKHLVGDPDLSALMDEVGDADAAVNRPKLARVYFVRGQRQSLLPFEPAPELHELSTEERALGEVGRERKYLGLVDQLDPRAMTWDGELAALDRLTAAEWLRGMGASPGYIAGQFLPLGDGLESISALSFARELASIRVERRAAGTGLRGGRIAGGADNLPRVIANRLDGCVVYGAEVLRIEHRADGAVLVVRDRTGRHRIDAARVVLTMPFPVLRRIEVAPAWSPAKGRAIAALDMTAVTRIWLVAHRRFWNERGEAGRVATDTDLHVVHDETEGLPGIGGVLGMYLSGQPARLWGAFDREAAIWRGAGQVERLHPGISEHLVGGDRVAWTQERFAGGAYAYFAPGQLTAHAAAAAAPEGVIHFAGDGTSHRPGFMHGAVASARRVVAEIAAASPAEAVG